MASDILASLELDKQFQYGRVIVVKEINGCDSSFIISCVLSHGIKKGDAILVVSSHNSMLHYRNVGLKMNYNIQKYMDTGFLDFYNIGDESVKALLFSEPYSLEHILFRIKEKLLLMQEKHKTFIVIVDGVSHLFDLQFTLKQVNHFCEEVQKLVRDFMNSMVMFHCNVATEGDLTNVLANLLSHKAEIILEVESLSSGWSSDVSGQLTVKYPGRKFDSQYLSTLDLKPAHYLFKLFDRGVKLFAPGTV